MSRCESQNLAGLASSRSEMSSYESQSHLKVRSSFVQVAGKLELPGPNFEIRFGPLLMTLTVRL